MDNIYINNIINRIDNIKNEYTDIDILNHLIYEFYYSSNNISDNIYLILEYIVFYSIKLKRKFNKDLIYYIKLYKKSENTNIICLILQKINTMYNEKLKSFDSKNYTEIYEFINYIEFLYYDIISLKQQYITEQILIYLYEIYVTYNLYYKFNNLVYNHGNTSKEINFYLNQLKYSLDIRSEVGIISSINFIENNNDIKKYECQYFDLLKKICIINQDYLSYAYIISKTDNNKNDIAISYLHIDTCNNSILRKVNTYSKLTKNDILEYILQNDDNIHPRLLKMIQCSVYEDYLWLKETYKNDNWNFKMIYKNLLHKISNFPINSVKLLILSNNKKITCKNYNNKEYFKENKTNLLNELKHKLCNNLIKLKVIKTKKDLENEKIFRDKAESQRLEGISNSNKIKEEIKIKENNILYKEKVLDVMKSRVANINDLCNIEDKDELLNKSEKLLIDIENNKREKIKNKWISKNRIMKVIINSEIANNTNKYIENNRKIFEELKITIDSANEKIKNTKIEFNNRLIRFNEIKKEIY